MQRAFHEVNEKFQDVFKKFFGGGNAELQFIDSDDPLEAGLEVFAQLPGKKLIEMSSLSGGEKGLVSLSLIFAVFLTNPSPICVLDEVDAALDDSNVEKFCDLIEDISSNVKTRFLVEELSWYIKEHNWSERNFLFKKNALCLLKQCISETIEKTKTQPKLSYDFILNHVPYQPSLGSRLLSLDCARIAGLWL